MAAREKQNADSSSEDEPEEIQRLREAASGPKIEQWKTKDSPKEANIPNETSAATVPIHRPRDGDRDKNQGDGPNTTPEFKTFIAKKLSEMIDDSLEMGTVPFAGPHTRDSDDDSMNLFSKRTLKAMKKKTIHVKKKPDTKREHPKDNSDSDSSEDERCRQVAVTADFVFKDVQKSDIVNVDTQDKPMTVSDSDSVTVKHKTKKHKHDSDT